MSVAHLWSTVAGAFVVGEFQFAEGDLLSHPVGPRVRRLRVDVHFISWNK